MSTVTKVTLWGPPPFGGSITGRLDDPIVARALADGWTERRRWEVEVVLDGPHPRRHAPSCGCDECVPDPFDTNEEARGER